MLKKQRENKGITLVALVITIIIMLILAGVAISAISGADGLFERAKSVGERYNNSSKNELDEINRLKEWLGNDSNEEIKYEIDQFKEFGKTIINFNISVEEGIKSIEVNGQQIEITEGEKNREFSIQIIDTNNVNIKVTKTNGEVIEKNITLEENTYHIYNAEQMKLFRNTVNNGEKFEGKTIQIMKDIDLGAKKKEDNTWEGEAWSPIASTTEFKRNTRRK